MADRQQALAPPYSRTDVLSLSSFIGVDGKNGTLNKRALSDQFETAGRTAVRNGRRCHPAAADRDRGRRGITLYMQPVQILTLDNT